MNESEKGNVILLPHTAVGEAVRRSARAKLYHKLGYKVHVSPKSQLKSNREAFDFLFSKNPYISGERDAGPDDVVDGIVTEPNPFRRITFNPKLLQAKEFTLEERKAELFYRPQPVTGIEKRTILDLNISSYRLGGGRDNFDRIEAYVLEHYPGALVILRENYDLEVRGFGPLPVARQFEAITYRILYDYCDIVSSCNKVACLQTGSEPFACFYNDRVDCLRTESFNAGPSDQRRLIYFDCNVTDIDLQ